jgi:2-haloacid dehalogenase
MPATPTHLELDRFEALTFDCYGTLIDWERGILRALDTLLPDSEFRGGRARPDGDELLGAFGRFESEIEAGSFRRYREVLIAVAHRFGDAYGVAVDGAAASRFAGSVPEWPPFPDTVEALRVLADRYRLAIVSNVDDDLFRGTSGHLGVDFEVVVTAEQVGSYKPHRAHFDEALRRLDLPEDRVLHVAQSLYHDIRPAVSLGLKCVWVRRRAGVDGAGATPPATATPDLEVPDLRTLASMAGG